MLLEVEDLRVEFAIEEGRLPAVDGVSFSLADGRWLGVVGESGCGKSVTALSLLKLLPSPPAKIAGGRVRFDGRDLLPLGSDELSAIRGREVGFVFQDAAASLDPVFTVGYQIAETLRRHHPEWSAARVKARVLEVLGQVGMPEPERRLEDYPHQLSGGLRQRAMIAIALANSPRLLVADEPTTALDVTIQAQILELLRRLQRELGMAVLFITHDLGVVSETADDVLVMYAGKIVESAPSAELFASPRHPYTQALLESLPTISDGEPPSRLPAIPGTVPHPLRRPPGCRFQDRCRKAQPHCRVEEPALEVRHGRLVACFEA